MNTTENGTILLCNDTNGTCVKSAKDIQNLASTTISIIVLCTTAIVGTVSNVAALNKLRKPYWRKHLSIVQLLVTGIIVCSILAPIQIIRTSLIFAEFDILPLCNVHHFIHLHVDVCTYITLIQISFERHRKIQRRLPRNSILTTKRIIVLLSWILVLPVTIYIIYKDNTNSPISIFSMDCMDNRILENYLSIVEFIEVTVFYITLVTMVIIYILVICKLSKKMSNRIGVVNVDTPFHCNTPVIALEPRSATRVDITRVVPVSPDTCQSQTPRHSSVRSESKNPENFQSVLSELKSRYARIELNKNNIQSDSASVSSASGMMNYGSLYRLRKLSETMQNQSKVKAESSIAKALDKFSNVSLFPFAEQVEQDVLLNPLKHTRRSAGNAWHEDTLKQSRTSSIHSQTGSPSLQSISRTSSLQSFKKKKRLPKLPFKLKKQYSSDSIGTCSDTSGFTEIKTDSDRSSTTYTSEGMFSVLNDGLSKISVIIEQPEPETLSLSSRKPSNISRQHSTESNRLRKQCPNNLMRQLSCESNKISNTGSKTNLSDSKSVSSEMNLLPRTRTNPSKILHRQNSIESDISEIECIIEPNLLSRQNSSQSNTLFRQPSGDSKHSLGLSTRSITQHRQDSTESNITIKISENESRLQQEKISTESIIPKIHVSCESNFRVKKSSIESIHKCRSSAHRQSREDRRGSGISDLHFSDVPMRPRCHSTSSRTKNDNYFFQDEGFRRRCHTEGSKTMTNPPNRQRIRNLRNKKSRKMKRNKPLPPIPISQTTLSAHDKKKTNYSTDCSDSCQEYYLPTPIRKNTNDNSSGNRSSSDGNLDWSDCSCSSSIFIPKSPSGLFKAPMVEPTEPKLVDSMTQTEENIIIIKKGSITSNGSKGKFPDIRVIGPNVKEVCQIENSDHLVQHQADVHHEKFQANKQSQSSSLHKTTYHQNTTPNSWFSDTEERTTSQLQIHSPYRLPTGRSSSFYPNMSTSMTSVRSNVRNKTDLGKVIRRSALIILSFALFYLPKCTTVLLLNHFSTEHGLSLLQVSRCVQYLYFAILPMIYVYTNQGLLNDIKRNPTGS